MSPVPPFSKAAPSLFQSSIVPSDSRFVFRCRTTTECSSRIQVPPKQQLVFTASLMGSAIEVTDFSVHAHPADYADTQLHAHAHRTRCSPLQTHAHAFWWGRIDTQHHT